MSLDIEGQRGTRGRASRREFRRCRTKNVYRSWESVRPPRKLHTYWREIRGESISTIFGSYAARGVRVRAMRSQYAQQKMERHVQGIPERGTEQDECRDAGSTFFELLLRFGGCGARTSAFGRDGMDETLDDMIALAGEGSAERTAGVP